MLLPSPVEDRNETITEDRTAVVDVQNARVEGNTLHGFACLYGAESEPIEDRGRRFTESIERGAFADVLADGTDTYLTLNHDPSRALARTPDSLRLFDEERGLRFEADIGDSPTAQDVRDAVKRKVLRGASFRFQVADGGERWDGTERRTLTKVGRLIDISLATTPAYRGTSVELRSHDQSRSRPGLTVEMRSALTGPAEETRARISLAPEDRMHTWQTRRGLASFSDRDAREFSLGRAVRGMATGDWTDAALEQRALAEGADATGGFAVPAPLATYTLDLIRNAARVVEAGATTVPMESETLTIPRLSAPPTAEWHVENEPIDESDPAFERVTLKAKTATVLTKVSAELWEDISPSAADRVTNSLVQALALEMDRVSLRGSGTGPEPLGLRFQEGIELRSMGTNGGKLTGWKALIEAIGAIKGRNIMPTGIIESSRTAETLASLVDTLGQPLQPPQYVREVPVYETNQVPINTKQGTSNAASEIFVGRWSDLLIGVRPSIGIRLRQLNERFADSLSIGLLAWLRMDVAVAHPQSFSVITGVIE